MFLGQVEYAGFSLSVAGKKGKGISKKEIYKLEAAGLAQSLQRLTAEWEFVDSDCQGRTNTQRYSLCTSIG